MKYLNQIVCGDSLEIMREMPDKSVDLVLTSPPYDNLREYEGYVFDFESTAKELFRLLKDGGIIVWVVGDQVIDGSESGTSFKQALYFKDLGLNIHDTMIYAKNGPVYPSQNRYYQIFEYMFVFSKVEPKTFNPIKDRINKWEGTRWSKTRSRRGKDGKLKSVPWDADQGGKFGVRFNIWKYSVGAGYSTKDLIAFDHPAIFPDKLAGDHIISWTNKGDLVLDPFGGSCTTGKMAKELGRNFICIEKEHKYCDIGERRLAQEVMDL